MRFWNSIRSIKKLHEVVVEILSLHHYRQSNLKMSHRKLAKNFIQRHLLLCRFRATAGESGSVSLEELLEESISSQNEAVILQLISVCYVSNFQSANLSFRSSSWIFKKTSLVLTCMKRVVALVMFKILKLCSQTWQKFCQIERLILSNTSKLSSPNTSLFAGKSGW